MARIITILRYPDFLFYALNLPFIDALLFLELDCIFPSPWLVLWSDFVTEDGAVDVIGNPSQRGHLPVPDVGWLWIDWGLAAGWLAHA